MAVERPAMCGPLGRRPALQARNRAATARTVARRFRSTIALTGRGNSVWTAAPEVRALPRRLGAPAFTSDPTGAPPRRRDASLGSPSRGRGPRRRGCAQPHSVERRPRSRELRRPRLLSGRLHSLLALAQPVGEPAQRLLAHGRSPRFTARNPDLVEAPPQRGCSGGITRRPPPAARWLASGR
jgi:hypothetical protein